MPNSLPEPKYKIGDVVFHAHGWYGSRQITCPDCLGKRFWSVTTPAGETFDLPCGTCERGYQSTGTISEYAEVTKVTPLTVGSVRIDTAANAEERVSYMCEETGVGSGSIYYETSLFLDHEPALLFATKRAAEQTAERKARDAEIQERAKKKARRKPEWYTRRIRELEKALEERSHAE